MVPSACASAMTIYAPIESDLNCMCYALVRDALILLA